MSVLAHGAGVSAFDELGGVLVVLVVLGVVAAERRVRRAVREGDGTTADSPEA